MEQTDIDQRRIARLKRPLTRYGAEVFRSVIYHYYAKHMRSFPWRETTNPYHILVSEVMLQQTQTDRVLQKYLTFIERFPDFNSLALASMRDVLDSWVGLGYNRRALALKRAAQIVVFDYSGTLPCDENLLIKLPGIGRYSASAICAFACNMPTVFIETNIRMVFRFLFRSETMTDNSILELVRQTVDADNPRDWYYALFDYGAMLKKLKPSKGYGSERKVTVPFSGSDRQIRGAIVRKLIQYSNLTEAEIIGSLAIDQRRLSSILSRLQQEGFIIRDGDRIKLAGE